MLQKNGVLSFCIKLNLRSYAPLEYRYRGMCFECYLPFHNTLQPFGSVFEDKIDSSLSSNCVQKISFVKSVVTILVLQSIFEALFFFFSFRLFL